MKVVHKKPECISCGACAALHPEQWVMDNDGLAQLVDGHKDGDNYVRSLTIEEVEDYQEAESVCPVNIILVDTK